MQMSSTATFPISPSSSFSLISPVAASVPSLFASGVTLSIMPAPGALHWLPTNTSTRLYLSSGTSKNRLRLRLSASMLPSLPIFAPNPARPEAKPSLPTMASPLIEASPSTWALPIPSVWVVLSSMSLRRKGAPSIKESRARRALPIRLAVFAYSFVSSRMPSKVLLSNSVAAVFNMKYVVLIYHKDSLCSRGEKIPVISLLS